MGKNSQWGSSRMPRGGAAGRGPGRSGKGALTGPNGMGRNRPTRGWGANGGPAGKSPDAGGFWNWFFGTSK